MKKDFKYILKRILIGVGIVLVMSFINSCDVHAATINMTNKTSTWRSYPQQTNNSFSWGVSTTMQSSNSLTNVYIETYFVNTPVYAGSYLFDLYIVTDELIPGLEGCKGLVTDFRVFDSSTNAWLSAVSKSKSNCIDSYYTTYDGQKAYHILTQWTLNNPNDAQDLLGTRGSFSFYNGTYGLTNYKSYTYDFIILPGTLQNYSETIVSDFRKTAQQDKTNTLIENQTTTQHNDSINEQNAINSVNQSINDSSIPSDSESKINNITSRITANQNSSIVQIATFFPQMLQLIINGMNTSCTGGYSLGSLYGTELRIPCINPVDYLGSTIWGTIDAILCLCYLIPLCKFLVNKYNDLTSMKNLRWGR